ncbi:anthocyanidin 3-O-glucosyltransferase 2-like [Salvia miltiorrhiza]|uniref:anthocyanidin 3-O-glucosyltransferase 2-like n=1 Tax=Salvia miltiorrhiza TaxID=226208 RepID=UPI0025AC11FB|nr:anthocyanidin 3-O-glucosyltransferase 2-like [Salvia miltiorrhiza]
MAVDEKASLVFIPFPVVSHLVTAVKTAELLAAHDSRLSITVLVMSMPTDTKISSYIKNPRINFVQLEQDVSNGAEAIMKPPKSMMHFAGRHRDSARAVVSEMKRSCRVAGIFVDIMCVDMIDVAKELKISSYIFFASGAAVLGLTFDLQSLRDDGGRNLAEFEGSDEVVTISSYVNPVPARVWPESVFDGESGFLELSRKAREADGIVINTFLELESYAIGSTYANERIPRFYPIGPIIGEGKDENDESRQRRGEIMRWLDGQPDSSVVFLCFGSMGAFGEEQVVDIAEALERSGKRFLWSLRKPIFEGGFAYPTEYENPGEVLPVGFLERTAGVGKVIGWAPQVAVLSHPSVGGFVSHCGWNSTLESVCCGVPMAAWPLGAEQQTNAFQLVKDIGIAVEIKMDYRKNSGEIVPKNIIEKAIKQLMDPTNEIRVRVKELKEKSTRALMEGGSSYNHLGLLIHNFFKSC